MKEEKRYLLLIAGLFFIALIFRFTYVFYGPPLSTHVWSDMRGYVSKADQILEGVWKETHFFQSIGYPLLVSAFKKLFFYWGYTLSFFQSLLSLATLFLMYKSAHLWFGKKIAVIVLLIGALHLPWVFFINLALPEVTFTFLLALLAWLTSKIVLTTNHSLWMELGWGVTFLLSFWLKGTHAFLLPLTLLSLLLLKRRFAWRSVIIIGGVVLMGLLAHGSFAYQKVGKFKVSAATGGLNFVEGKCPAKRNSDSLGYSWLSPLYHQLGLKEEKKWNHPFTDSAYFMRQGFKCIQENPLVLLQSFESIPYLFYGNTMWPLYYLSSSHISRLYEVYFAFFLVVGLTVYLKMLAAQKWPAPEMVVWLVPIASLFLCSYVFKSEIRYRLPFDVWLIPIAVKGWWSLFHTNLDHDGKLL